MTVACNDDALAAKVKAGFKKTVKEHVL